MRRSPLGLRGLKSDCDYIISNPPYRSPLGLRGLKFACGQNTLCSRFRSPLGLRGLKSEDGLYTITSKVKSQPTRAAWIEILKSLFLIVITLFAAHSGCVD